MNDVTLPSKEKVRAFSDAVARFLTSASNPGRAAAVVHDNTPGSPYHDLVMAKIEIDAILDEPCSPAPLPTHDGGRYRKEGPTPEPESEQQSHTESDGCPTEMAVLKRFWREHRPTDTRPTAWMRGHRCYRPGEPDDYDVECVYGDDPPDESGTWIPLYHRPCVACAEFVRMQHDIASLLGVDDDTDSIDLHGRIYEALSTRAPPPPKSDQCEVCTKPLPPVGAWSMPSCPDCQELLEGLGQLMGDFADREQTIKADWIGRAINLICARPSPLPPDVLKQISDARLDWSMACDCTCSACTTFDNSIRSALTKEGGQ